MKNQHLEIENQAVKEIKAALENQQQKTKKNWTKTNTTINILGSIASIIGLILFLFISQPNSGDLTGLRRDNEKKSSTKQQSAIPNSQQVQYRVNVQVLDKSGNPVESASILLISQNTTYLEGKTNSAGKTVISYYGHRIFTVFCAHPNFPAFVRKDFDPKNFFLLIQLSRSDNIGSVVFPNETGYIPGLEGRLAPIFDSSKRMYFYADNIAINGGEIQPVAFMLSNPVKVEDQKGNCFTIRFIGVIGRSWLIEFQSRGKHHE